MNDDEAWALRRIGLDRNNGNSENNLRGKLVRNGRIIENFKYHRNVYMNLFK